MAASWHRNSKGCITDIDWSDWTVRDRHIDPYLVWADITNFAGFSSPTGAYVGDYHDKWPFIIELTRAGLPAPDQTGNCANNGAPWVCGLMQIPGVYLLAGAGQDTPQIWSKHITARVSPSVLEHVLCSPEVVRIQLGLPRIPATLETKITGGLPIGGKAPRVVVGIIDDGCAFAHPRFRHSSGSRSVVRYLWDQDPDRMADNNYWSELQDIGYGAELTPATLLRALAGGNDPDSLTPYELTRYGRVRFDEETHSTKLLDPQGMPLSGQHLSSMTHGTAVMDLAVGYPPPLREQVALAPRLPDAMGGERLNLGKMMKRLPENELCGEEGDRWRAAVDQGDNVDVVFVQLPARCVMDTSGGSLAVHVLDGLHYIIERAVRLPYNDEEPSPGQSADFINNIVIANVSYGAIAGGHDGTSILEGAMAELTASRTPLSIVVAAGNANRSRTHARLILTPGGDPKAFIWRIGPDNPRDAFLEIWFPHADEDGRPINPAFLRSMSLSIEPPGMDPLPIISLGDVAWFGEGPSALTREGASTVLAGVVFCNTVAQSTKGTMALIAVSPTRLPARDGSKRQAAAPHGDWTIFVKFNSVAVKDLPRVRVHAWTERDDMIYADRRPQQSSIVSDDPIPETTEFMPETSRVIRRGMSIGGDEWAAQALQPDYSMGSVAGSHRQKEDFWFLDSEPRSVVAVGGYRLVDGEMARYSSGGPERLASSLDERSSLFGPLPRDEKHDGSKTRLRPDVDAPSDVGIAVRGLRVAGTRSTQVVRLSGTSAAAPSVTRALVNYFSAYKFQEVKEDFPFSIDFVKCHDRLARLLFGDIRCRAEAAEDVSRPVPTPKMDDAFRKGRRRIR